VKRFAGELFNTLVDLAKVDVSTGKRLTALVAPQVSAADQEEESASAGTTLLGDDPTAPAGSPAAAVRAFLLSAANVKASGGKTRKVAWITLHAAIFDFLTAPRTLQQVAAQLRNAPMLIPPHPWTGPTVGPYLITPVPLMRTKNKLQLLMLQKPDTNLDTVCKALNVLGATPWKINKLTLAVVQEAWNNGGGIADLPPRADLSTPPTPHALLTNNEQEALRALYDYKRQVRRVDRINSERHSLRCDFLLKLGVAETYVKEERFYFPHNLDFRGRAYPVPPHLNHIGADLARGLLKFADGRPLGKDGLWWMKVCRKPSPQHSY
jgi:DNA-directed RNA polymerase